MSNRRRVVAVVTALVLGLVAAPSASAGTVLVLAEVDGYDRDAVPAGRQASTEPGAARVVRDDEGGWKFRVASTANGGTIEVRFGAPDGPLLGSVAVPVTGGGQTWTEVTAPVIDPGSTHELFLVARNPGATGDLFNVDWFEFGPEV